MTKTRTKIPLPVNTREQNTKVPFFRYRLGATWTAVHDIKTKKMTSGCSFVSKTCYMGIGSTMGSFGSVTIPLPRFFFYFFLSFNKWRHVCSFTSSSSSSSGPSRSRFKLGRFSGSRSRHGANLDSSGMQLKMNFAKDTRSCISIREVLCKAYGPTISYARAPSFHDNSCSTAGEKLPSCSKLHKMSSRHVLAALLCEEEAIPLTLDKNFVFGGTNSRFVPFVTRYFHPIYRLRQC